MQNLLRKKGKGQSFLRTVEQGIHHGKTLQQDQARRR